MDVETKRKSTYFLVTFFFFVFVGIKSDNLRVPVDFLIFCAKALGENFLILFLRVYLLFFFFFFLEKEVSRVARGIRGVETNILGGLIKPGCVS